MDTAALQAAVSVSEELACHHILKLVVAAWGQDCSRTRPADILVTNWDNGISAAFDVTVTSLLNSDVIMEAGMNSGIAARAAEFRKCSEK
eukprot:Em0022g920a